MGNAVANNHADERVRLRSRHGVEVDAISGARGVLATIYGYGGRGVGAVNLAYLHGPVESPAQRGRDHVAGGAARDVFRVEECRIAVVVKRRVFFFPRLFQYDY